MNKFKKYCPNVWVTEMEELKACPFCGGIGKEQSNEFGDRAVYCSKCGASTMRWYPDKSHAISAWNRRTAPENKPLAWIPVSERLPETCCTCFAWFNSKEFGGRCVSAHYNSIKNNFGYTKDEGIVTHWMLIPEPPDARKPEQEEP